MNTPVNTLHAHYSTTARDCDGRYDSAGIRFPFPYDSRESFEFDIRDIYTCEDEFEETFDSDGRHGFESSEVTEEGYRSTDVTFCTDAHCVEAEVRRDLSAERAGY